MTYNTSQKRKIQEYLESNKNKFVSAEEILNYLKEKKIEVGTTTVYRFLNNLEKEELVRTEVKNHTKYYQYIDEDCDAHFHLKCKKCGKEVHLECDEFEHVNEHINNEHKFKLDHNTMIYGVCEDCDKGE